MSIKVSHPTQIIKGKIHLPFSKSQSNRALIIQALCDDDFEIHNLSEAEDTVILKQLLNSINSELNVKMAGTAMRFLTALKTIQKEECILTGDDRMKERPIKVLVDALRELGADIEYLEKEGYPPLKLTGKELQGDKIKIDGSISSQYVSALLMIAPKLENGLQIEFSGAIVSKSYIIMTIEMMKLFGVSVQWEGNIIIVESGTYKSNSISIEADWSAASYWYSLAALAKEVDITLYGLKQNSIQGDAMVKYIYESFGVETEFVENGIRLTKNKNIVDSFEYDFTNCPDIAQTVAATCAALNVRAKLTGLKTLRIKETDRVIALQTELNKLGFNVKVEGDDLIIYPVEKVEWKNGMVKTYNDHRMALAFAPLALLNEINIENQEVIKKSYPEFWVDLMNLDFIID